MLTNPTMEPVPARTKDQLRFITCGSVDDGKSTLIGRLLHDSKMIYHDQITALERDSIKYGSTGNNIDFALLVDGLEAEREQGITIDVAYRFFSTPRRSFMVADTPGHEQYTRNMATGASQAQLAIILIDARKGVMVQTRRHSFICALLGIRHIVLAVNKIDLVAYDKECFDRIARDYLAFAAGLGFTSIVPIPISARDGDNVVDRSARANWYHGPCLLEYLESIDIQSGTASQAFRFPVQWVNRPNPEFRGYAGDVLSRPDNQPEVADQFAAYVIWMDEEPLAPGRNYVLRIGSQTIAGSITEIRHRIDVNTCEHLAAGMVSLNEIAFCNVATTMPAVFDPYDVNRKTGSFIFIDRYTNRTAGAGMIAFPLRRAANIARQGLSVDRRERAALKNQKPCVIWFTGLSGAGKSAIANLVDQKLFAMSRHTMLLDGDNLRHGLSVDLGFSEADRVENIRRVGEVAKLMADSGLIVICSLISPTRAERDRVRTLVGKEEFIEVFVDTPIEECARRDPKGLYSKVKSGKIKNFTGIDACYEAPATPDIHLRTMEQTLEHSAKAVVDFLMARSILDG
ncbi:MULTISPECIES: adenylyl-sulfate kinase [unclassified Bradyrhizobium]|uniref:adenylyl-sulfate kinase n=1 Tax=unclassified Bradyrhizobium TaxID=2631580 RepID=UPI0023025B26|nr:MULTISPECIES: adenylyl-sulfate kinase [unclassified Bradyrhizobium]MDA9399911.1 adenylyltransferase [Bradyrhizobium sp. CCBAU 45389]MDA9527199.1 adenylyltransferase [Bradyrhizobium sp. CCBAU 25338]